MPPGYAAFAVLIRRLLRIILSLAFAAGGLRLSAAQSTAALLELGHCPVGNTTLALPGSGHFCSITADSQVACAGANLVAQALVPAPLTTQTANALFVCTGLKHSCAVAQSGASTAVTCWGDNGQGQSSPPGGLNNAISISCGGAHTCAILSTRAVVCWGKDWVSPRRVVGQPVQWYSNCNGGSAQ
jgi:alpha-tubulin suppressor-like RCC1 family protein